jgi:hypothetical protein
VREADLQAAVMDIARLFGWRSCHFRPAQTAKGWRTPIEGDKGFPDCVLARDDRLVFAELKSATGKLTPDQVEWIDRLAHVRSTEMYVFRPTDLDDIARVLR